MNDLSYFIEKSTLPTYANDTQADLTHGDQWFNQKGMKTNSSNNQAVIMGEKNKGTKLAFKCKERQIYFSDTIAINDKLMSLSYDNSKIYRKVSLQVVVLKWITKLLPFETRTFIITF